MHVDVSTRFSLQVLGLLFEVFLEIYALYLTLALISKISTYSDAIIPMFYAR
jgi:hypothetical protein